MGETFGELVTEEKVGPDFETDPGETEEVVAMPAIEDGEELAADQIRLLKAIRAAATKKEKGADFPVYIIDIAVEHGAKSLLTAPDALTEKLVALQSLGCVTRDGRNDNWSLTQKGKRYVSQSGD